MRNDRRVVSRRSRFRSVDALIAMNGVSTFGSGLIYPYTAVYLAGHAQIGISGVGTFYGVSAGANLAATAVLALGWLRPPTLLLGIVGTASLTTGYLGVSIAGSLPTLALAATFVGGGQGCLLAAMVPVLNSLISVSDRRDVFARRYRAMNIGLGLGAVVAGLAAGLLSREVIPWLFVFNAVSYIPLAVLFAVIHQRAPVVAQLPPRSSGSTAGAAGGLSTVWSGAALVVVFQLGAYLFGHSQFEATAPLVASNLMSTGLASVSVLLLANTAVVVLGQKWITRWLAPRSEVFGLRVTMLLWTAGYLVVALASLGSASVCLAGLVVFAVIFALGECAYSCSYHPWLIASVAEHDVTRASALSSGMMGVGTAAGPSIGVALILTGSAVVVWLVLAACCALMLVTVVERSSTRRSANQPAVMKSGERSD